MASDAFRNEDNARRQLRLTRRELLRLGAVSLGAWTANSVLAGCAPGAAPPATGEQVTIPAASPVPTTLAGPKPGGVKIYAFEANPTGLDPHKVVSLASQNVLEQIYDTLFELDPDLNVVPRLAQSYEQPDDLTYIFHLVENAKFSDGTDLTAEDVVFTIERILDPDVGSPRASWFTPIDTIEAVDDHTVRITTVEPYAPLINALAWTYNLIVSKAFTESQDGNLDQATMGSGPFVMAEYVPDQVIRFEPNPHHWQADRPLLDAAEWRIIPDDQGRVAALRAKEIDEAWFIDATIAELFEDDPEYVVYEVPVLTHASTWINCSEPPLDDVRVRQAISYAIDRQEFLDIVAFGKGVLTGPIPAPEEEWAVPVSEFEMYTQNIDKAKELLAEAGYGDGFTVTLKVSPQYVLDTGNAQVLQRQLAEVGITVELESVEWGNLLSDWTNSDFQMLNLLMLGQPDPSGYTWGRFHSESSNFAQIHNAELDALLDEQRTTVDREERKAVLAEVQHKIVELTPMLYYYCYYVWGIFRPYVKGVTPMANSSYVYQEDEWLDK